MHKMADFHVPYDPEYYTNKQLEQLFQNRLNIPYFINKDDLREISNKFRIPVKFYDYFKKADQRWHKASSYKKTVVNYILNDYELKKRLKAFIVDIVMADIESINTELEEIREKNPGWSGTPFIYKIKPRSESDDMTDMDNASTENLKKDEIFFESKTEDLSDVESDWHPREGLFLEKDPKRIAGYLMRHSKDKGQAMKRLTFYMNRAGDNLENKTVLNKVKELLKSDDK